MEIKMFKLVTGDVIMGDSTEEIDGSFTIIKPVQLIMDPTQGGVGLMPYGAVFTQEEMDEINIKSEHIMHEFKVSKPFEDSYINFKTGIEVAQ